jgi:hypothetical protein
LLVVAVDQKYPLAVSLGGNSKRRSDRRFSGPRHLFQEILRLIAELRRSLRLRQHEALDTVLMTCKPSHNERVARLGRPRIVGLVIIHEL